MVVVVVVVVVVDIVSLLLNVPTLDMGVRFCPTSNDWKRKLCFVAGETVCKLYLQRRELDTSLAIWLKKSRARVVHEIREEFAKLSSRIMELEILCSRPLQLKK
jgi:hypothetical protein